jgi:hypothetical protein
LLAAGGKQKKAKAKSAGKGFGAPAAGAAAAAPPQPLAGYESFYAWLDAAGTTRRVAIANFGGLRGVMASEDIAEGEPIISVPSALAIDLGVEGEDPLPAARAFLRIWQSLQAARARGASAQLSSAERSALQLGPFIDAIPPLDSPDLSTPDFFAEGELAALQWPLLEADVEQRARALRDAADEALASGELAAGGDASAVVRQLNWARWVVLSRVLTVQDALPVGAAYGAPRAARKLLIPLIDMCNHHASRWNGIPSGRVGGGLSIIAATRISKGEQVRIGRAAARARVSI